MLSSRSVAVMVRRLPFASTSRFERMGIVVLRSTTPCVVLQLFEQIEFLYAEFHLEAALVCCFAQSACFDCGYSTAFL